MMVQQLVNDERGVYTPLYLGLCLGTDDSANQLTRKKENNYEKRSRRTRNANSYK
jgi:hypothetical protein